MDLSCRIDEAAANTELMLAMRWNLEECLAECNSSFLGRRESRLPSECGMAGVRMVSRILFELENR